MSLSALNNERFGRVLDQMMNSRTSAAVTFMRPGEGATGDYATAFSSYLDNGAG